LIGSGILQKSTLKGIVGASLPLSFIVMADKISHNKAD